MATSALEYGANISGFSQNGPDESSPVLRDSVFSGVSDVLGIVLDATKATSRDALKMVNDAQQRRADANASEIARQEAARALFMKNNPSALNGQQLKDLHTVYNDRFLTVGGHKNSLQNDNLQKAALMGAAAVDASKNLPQDEAGVEKLAKEIMGSTGYKALDKQFEQKTRSLGTSIARGALNTAAGTAIGGTLGALVGTVLALPISGLAWLMGSGIDAAAKAFGKETHFAKLANPKAVIGMFAIGGAAALVAPSLKHLARDHNAMGDRNKDAHDAAKDALKAGIRNAIFEKTNGRDAIRPLTTHEQAQTPEGLPADVQAQVSAAAGGVFASTPLTAAKSTEAVKVEMDGVNAAKAADDMIKASTLFSSVDPEPKIGSVSAAQAAADMIKASTAKFSSADVTSTPDFAAISAAKITGPQEKAL